MTRETHNALWKSDRKPDERVICNLFGYGEKSQYDPRCPACWSNISHTWNQHDYYLTPDPDKPSS